MAKKRISTSKAERDARNAEVDAAVGHARELVRRGFAELREKRGYDGLTPQFRAVIEGSTRSAERSS
jgi:predicted alpha/beta hydrolase